MEQTAQYVFKDCEIAIPLLQDMAGEPHTGPQVVFTAMLVLAERFGSSASLLSILVWTGSLLSQMHTLLISIILRHLRLKSPPQLIIR